MLDVAIVGGGPGGLYAARRLAEAGFSTEVFEEHEEIGRPVHCTGVLAADAFDRFHLSRSCILNELATARFVAPGGLEISYTTPKVEAIVVDRGALDRSLAAAATDAGTVLRLGARVTSVVPTDKMVRLETAIGPRIARFAVLACGAHYRLQRQLGFGTPPVALNSTQLELPAAHGGDVEVHFGGAVAPGGFAWAVPVSRPHGRFVRVGLMARGDGGPLFKQFVERVAGGWGVPREAIGQPRRRYLPLSPLSRTFTDRVLAVGDAAGLVKPTTGGGIFYSLVSASIAADVLSDALRTNRHDEATLSVYQGAWRKQLGPELRSQLALRMLAQRLTDGEIDAFFQLAHTNGVMPLVRRVAAFNQHRHLIAELFQHAPARRLLFRRLSPS